MTTSIRTPLRFCPTPTWLILALLVVECLLFLSDRFHWPTWQKGYAVLIAVASVGVVFVVMLLWLIVALVFRLRFQFSIRSLLILTIVVAIPCSWMAVEMKAARKQEATKKEIEKAGGIFSYDWQFDANNIPRQYPEPPGPEWLRKLLGDDFFGTVVGLEILYNEITTQIAGLTELQSLEVEYDAPIRE